MQNIADLWFCSRNLKLVNNLINPKPFNAHNLITSRMQKYRKYIKLK